MKNLFPSLPEAPTLGDVFKAFPDGLRPLLEFHDQVLRSPSDLSIAERELIAAYVSGLNACAFCTGAHTFIARAYGIAPAVIDQLLDDRDTADVDPKLQPILSYVAKLTQTPSRLTEADARAVYAAGWSEAALYDAIRTCALFNFMNRIVEGTGVAAYPVDPETATEDALRVRREKSYLDFGRGLGIIDD